MNATLRQLEGEAEAARAKLAADLAVLRSPSTYAEFKDGLKQEAMDARDAVVDSVRSNMKSTAESWIDDIKAKAAANPGAALLIGAGVAWRLLRNPPIATALVGAGLFSLLRTSPQPGARHMSDEEYIEQAKYRLREQASDLAVSAKEHATDLAGTAKEGALGFVDSARAQMHDVRDATKARAASLIDGAKDRASDLTEGAKTQVADWQDFAQSKTQEWRDAATAATQELRSEASGQVAGVALSTAGALDDAADAVVETRDRAKRRIAAAADYTATAASNGYAAVQRTARDAVSEQGRDKLLLGAAGIAVTAALTLALQRRINGTA